MPEIIRLGHVKICVYSGDHRPPHFHVRGVDWSASIVIASFRILKGRGPKRELEEAIKWAMQPDNQYRLSAEGSHGNKCFDSKRRSPRKGTGQTKHLFPWGP